MKKLILILTIFISIQSFAQVPTGYQKRIVNERIQGSFMVDSAFNPPRYYDTTAANLHKRSDTCGAMFFAYGIDSLYYRACNPKRWISVGSGSGSGSGLQNYVRCGLLSGGIVAWTGTGLNFNASEAFYNLDYIPYHFTGDSISLSAADGTFGRFDAIVLTSSGLSKITGTASADPQLPQFDPCENILLTYVLVGAGATTPTQVSDEVIYDENVETWTHSTSGTISSNFASTTTAFHGTKTIALASWSNNANILFTAPGSIVQNNYTSFSFWIKLSAIMTSNQNISVQFFNGTTAVSNLVVCTFTKGNITTFQSVMMNMTLFTFTSSSFTNIHLVFSGTNANNVYIDWVRLQGGITQPTSGGTPTLHQVTTAGNTTTNSITVANVSWKGGTGSTLGQNGATSVGLDNYGTLQLGNTANVNQGIIYTDVLTGTRTYKLPNTSGTIALTSDITAFAYSRNMITAVATGTNANITAAAGTAYSLPAATLSTDRTIDMTNLNTNGDYIEIDNQEAGFTWSFTGQTVYDAYETAVTVLFANTRYIIRRTNGKLKIIN